MKLTRRNFIKSGLITSMALGGLGSAMANASEKTLFPQHEAIGVGKGIFPGRVVWVHEPGSINWNGMDFWWKPENYQPDLILKMVQDGLMGLTGASSASSAWHKLFEYRNKINGKSGDYQKGEKIAIKPNMNGAGEYNDDPKGEIASPYGNAVLLKALLLSLVQDGNVSPKDVVIYDSCRIFPDYMRKMCTEGSLKGVIFRQRDPYGPLDARADQNALIKWSGAVRGEKTYFPQCLTNSTYLINLANLKGHSWGMTLGAKNHFGSFVNSERRVTPQAAGLHDNIINGKMGDYSVLADLIGKEIINDKTILWVMDALITAPSETGNITPENAKWEMDPFNGDYPCSLFFSQDPIAIDSVGADFLTSDPAMRRHNGNLAHKAAMENYLHEAALLANPPSGTKYDTGSGKRPQSLGVHEHWNNAKDKLYGRNRGLGEGIELIKL